MRRWAMACSSMSSCCLACSSPDLDYANVSLINSISASQPLDLRFSRRIAHLRSLRERCGAYIFLSDCALCAGFESHSRLCLGYQVAIQWCWVKGILHAIAQNVHNVDSRVRGGTRLVVTAGTCRAEGKSARSTASGSGACIRIIWWRAWKP